MDEMEKTILSAEQAEAMLADGEDVHAFVNPGVNVLLGADWGREEVLQYLKTATSIELAGPAATRMKHGLAVHGDRGLVFFATKP